MGRPIERVQEKMERLGIDPGSPLSGGDNEPRGQPVSPQPNGEKGQVERKGKLHVHIFSSTMHNVYMYVVLQWNSSNPDTIGPEESTQTWYLGRKKVSCLEKCPYGYIEGFHCIPSLVYCTCIAESLSSHTHHNYPVIQQEICSDGEVSTLKAFP